MSELKPCPFCGSNNVSSEGAGIEVDDYTAWIDCEDCGAQSNTFESDAQAIDAWNRRAPEAGQSDKYRSIQESLGTEVVAYAWRNKGYGAWHLTPWTDRGQIPKDALIEELVLKPRTQAQAEPPRCKACPVIHGANQGDCDYPDCADAAQAEPVADLLPRFRMDMEPDSGGNYHQYLRADKNGEFIRWSDFEQLCSHPQQPADQGEDIDQILQERDDYHDIADNLTAAIAKHFNVDFGEHSNLNSPWREALDFMRGQEPEHPAEPQEPVADGSDEIAMRAELLHCVYRRNIDDAVEMMLERGWTKQPQRPAWPDGWISVDDKLPPDADPVLVYTPENEFLQFAIDQWCMQTEAPVEFSSATIETGYMWCEHEFEEVTHWKPLAAPGMGE
jgi:Lar family restriction alleviation protein